MPDTEGSRLIGELRARVSAIEDRQTRMETRQDKILEGLDTIRSQLDRAAGGVSIVRYAIGFLGLGTMAGCVAFAETVYNWFRLSK